MALTTTPASLTVAAGNAPKKIGIATPVDTTLNPATGQPYPEADLTVIVTGVPTDGTVYLSDGVTPVINGEFLSAVELTGLTFAANPGATAGTSSTFTYTAMDPTVVMPVGSTTPTGGTFATGTVTLSVAAASGPVTTPVTLAVNENASATSINIPAPTGGTGTVTYTVLGLPGYGLPVSGTPTSVGTVTLSEQLTGLTFTPTAGNAAFSTQFSYEATDSSGNSTLGTAELDINPVGTATSTLSTIAAKTSSSTGSITGTVLTLTGTTTGTFYAGEVISGTGVNAGTRILSQLTGTTGSAGTYTLDTDNGVASTTITGTYGLLTVGTVVTGTFEVGGVLSGLGVTSGTTITALGTGSDAGKYVVSPSQTVSVGEAISQTNTLRTVGFAGPAGSTEYATIQAAITAAVSGDTIQVKAGTYSVTSDITITQNLTFEGVGGMVNLVDTSPDSLRQAIFITRGDDTINNFSFSRAQAIPHQSSPIYTTANAAEIRYQSGNLVLNDDYFFNNQNGLLGGNNGIGYGVAGGTGTITINNSEFANNGVTSSGLPSGGATHNIYVGNIASVTINNSYFHNANVGQEIKSRAANTIVINSRIQDNATGTSSYEISTPDGGNLVVQNDVVQQSSLSQNSRIITTGEEGYLFARSSLLVTSSTIINDLLSGTIIGVQNDTPAIAQITSDHFYGLTAGQVAGGTGPNTQSGNTLSPESSEPTLITTQPWAAIGAAPCFLRGTLIRTEAGEIAVEELAIGDEVVTVSGGAKPIRWIGRRAYEGRFVAGNRVVLPIRVAAGALADGVPARDLCVSPEHALYTDGVLVPARQLVNGATIVQVEAIDRVEYFHIELESHEIIFAEGAPTESFVDCDNRLMFQNSDEFARLYPDDTRAAWDFCAPRLDETSAELPAIRAALLQRAEALGYALDLDPELQLIVDGQAMRPSSVSGDRHRFDIPAGSTALWLASRSTVPAETTAASRDVRRLGVAVERIALRHADRVIEAWHGDAALHEGFHADEGSHRWTDGLARLPETWLRSFPEGFILEVDLAPSELGYRLPPPTGIGAVAA